MCIRVPITEAFVGLFVPGTLHGDSAFASGNTKLEKVAPISCTISDL